MEKLTICSLTVGIGHPWALVGIFVLTVAGENSLMVEFLDAVARLELVLVELRDELDQGGQSRIHR
jgi:hypothetical protein